MEDQRRKLLCQLPQRLKGPYSDHFKNLEVLSNYFKVQLAKITDIYVFKVKFDSGIALDNTKIRLSLLEDALSQIKKVIPTPIISSNNLYSHEAPKDSNEFVVEAKDTKIYIKQVKVLKFGENPAVAFQFLNISLKNIMRKHSFSQLGKSRKFFNMSEFSTPDHEIKMFSGYQANFLQTESGIFLRVDPTKKIVRNETVLSFINKTYAQNKHKEREQKRSLVRESLIGKTIMTNYGKARYVRVDDLVFESIDSIFIPETNTSLREYYQNKYTISIKNDKQPLLLVTKKGCPTPDYMIPELCLMTGLPDSFDQMRRKKISDSTIKSPSEKREQIQSLMRIIRSEKQIQVMEKLGIKVNTEMKPLKAKSVPVPVIQLGEGKSIQKGRQAGFQLFANPIYQSHHQVKLGIIHGQKANIRDVLQTFKNTSAKLQVSLKIMQMNLGDIDPRKCLNAFLNHISQAADEGCNMVFVAIPNTLKNQYKKIKEHCLMEACILSQVACESTLGKKNVQSIATKILLQIIAKKGNTLWVPSFSKQISHTMIVGFDNASVGGKSVVSICSTINSTFSSVFTLSERYSSNEDKMVKMSNLLCKTMQFYVSRNKNLPNEVIIFHNSCTLDQVKLFLEYFLEPAKQKIEKAFNKCDRFPHFTFVLVNKKTNERFFSMGRSENDIRNVPAGTLVSSGIVSENYDFFLVSQFSSKGSTVPNHYKIVYTDSKMEEGLLQELIFSQCFNYVNWTGSIKVPGIMQYAKKSSKFSSEILEGRELSEELSGNLYFV